VGAAGASPCFLCEFGTIVLALAWAFLVSTFRRGCFISDLSRLSAGAIPIPLIGWVRLIGGKDSPIRWSAATKYAAKRIWSCANQTSAADQRIANLPANQATPSQIKVFGIAPADKRLKSK